ncbi:GlmU family protein [Spirosoma utsteinense]|uniref:UDP-N-acetylglucosamine diphosphorylase/glucosamine-1-phosphate N-acetyltransferase n=1 Tax=Spirosoma utsteinense TaxID=2585773 RepID=A0ABR6W1B3_9BACT|nr:GlmU family protein [Spirosoma utsteinense]MBC3784983.1 UDP-N-acetylglucosamine diphosphorylase/glucosamine-1-phosphate N-acetyltransferase [Spirosoma utsteinense]MBC3790409.1 UDP-N-acetylglucosamine diphosphorylase/glucosamine-1-phosphate N-acetyltransferase [Spirosoma utsteinense]
MSNLILFDDLAIRTALLPFTFTRPVAEIRIGIRTVSEKWAASFGKKPSFQTQPYLQAKFPVRTGSDNWYVNGAVCPTPALQQAILELPTGEGLTTPDGLLLAVRTDHALPNGPIAGGSYVARSFAEPLTIVQNLWDIFVQNGDQIRADFAQMTAGRQSQPIADPFTRCYAPENIFIEPGATIRAAILNAEGGPIYIGRDATISEGSIVIGPFALGEGSTVNWGGKMRSNTTIGPFCKVGGEVGNSIFLGYSNKGHDGFLGNSVIGEWCNLGANVNNSNLKNDYTNVKLHSYATDQLEDTGRIFCGLMMADFTKAGISTMFNTGTVVGVSSNVFGGGFQPKYIPSFSWGGSVDGFTTYRIEKALQVAREAFSRRGKLFDAVEEGILRTIFSAVNGG